MQQENESEVLEEEFDPNYEPTQNEIVEYATFLGMNLETDKDLFWIAKEGLKAPLPEQWKPCKTKDEIYYFNFQTGESVWEHPCDAYYRQMFKEQKDKKSKQTGASASSTPASSTNPNKTPASTASTASPSTVNNNTTSASASSTSNPTPVPTASNKGSSLAPLSLTKAKPTQLGPISLPGLNKASTSFPSSSVSPSSSFPNKLKASPSTDKSAPPPSDIQQADDEFDSAMDELIDGSENEFPQPTQFASKPASNSTAASKPTTSTSATSATSATAVPNNNKSKLVSSTSSTITANLGSTATETPVATSAPSSASVAASPSTAVTLPSTVSVSDLQREMENLAQRKERQDQWKREQQIFIDREEKEKAEWTKQRETAFNAWKDSIAKEYETKKEKAESEFQAQSATLSKKFAAEIEELNRSHADEKKKLEDMKQSVASATQQLEQQSKLLQQKLEEAQQQLQQQDKKTNLKPDKKSASSATEDDSESSQPSDAASERLGLALVNQQLKEAESKLSKTKEEWEAAKLAWTERESKLVTELTELKKSDAVKEAARVKEREVEKSKEAARGKEREEEKAREKQRQKEREEEKEKEAGRSKEREEHKTKELAWQKQLQTAQTQLKETTKTNESLTAQIKQASEQQADLSTKLQQAEMKQKQTEEKLAAAETAAASALKATETVAETAKEKVAPKDVSQSPSKTQGSSLDIQPSTLANIGLKGPCSLCGQEAKLSIECAEKLYVCLKTQRKKIQKAQAVVQSSKKKWFQYKQFLHGLPEAFTDSDDRAKHRTKLKVAKQKLQQSVALINQAILQFVDLQSKLQQFSEQNPSARHHHPSTAANGMDEANSSPFDIEPPSSWPEFGDADEVAGEDEDRPHYRDDNRSKNQKQILSVNRKNHHKKASVGNKKAKGIQLFDDLPGLAPASCADSENGAASGADQSPRNSLLSGAGGEDAIDETRSEVSESTVASDFAPFIAPNVSSASSASSPSYILTGNHAHRQHQHAAAAAPTATTQHIPIGFGPVQSPVALYSHPYSHPHQHHTAFPYHHHHHMTTAQQQQQQQQQSVAAGSPFTYYAQPHSQPHTVLMMNDGVPMMATSSSAASSPQFHHHHQRRRSESGAFASSPDEYISGGGSGSASNLYYASRPVSVASAVSLEAEHSSNNNLFARPHSSSSSSSSSSSCGEYLFDGSGGGVAHSSHLPSRNPSLSQTWSATEMRQSRPTTTSSVLARQQSLQPQFQQQHVQSTPFMHTDAVVQTVLDRWSQEHEGLKQSLDSNFAWLKSFGEKLERMGGAQTSAWTSSDRPSTASAVLGAPSSSSSSVLDAQTGGANCQ